MTYRREIDGLRALAVLAVILFHAGIPGLPGGYVGVDVFFVISGYLITARITGALEAGRFSLAEFYARRARRLLPALFLVLASCLPLAAGWLTPPARQEFAGSLMAVVVFAANVFFFAQSGYFDTGAEYQPLLHTWSLGVEEQFYLLFPWLLLGWRAPRRRAWLLALLFITSLGFAAGLSWLASPAAFYLLPARAWEFLLGAGLACGERARTVAPRGPSPAPSPAGAGRGRLLDELGGAGGLAMIVGAVRFLDPHQAPSSLWLLLPTLGALLVIACARPATLAGRLLGHRLPAGLGLVSYSAYLWHQPLFAFLRLRSLGPLSLPVVGLAIGLTLGLAVLSWRYVERPCRFPRHPDRRRTAALALLGSLGLLAAGAAMRLASAPVVPVAPARPGVARASPGPVPARGIMLLGDSHAERLAFGLRYFLGTGMVVDRSAPACLPLAGVGVTFRDKRGRCLDQIGQALDEFARRRDLGLLVMASMGPAYLDDTRFRGGGQPRLADQRITLAGAPGVRDPWLIYAIGLRRTLARLRRHPGQRTLLVLDVPELGIDPAHCLYPPRVVSLLGTTFGIGAPTYANCRVPRAEFDQRTGRYRRLVLYILRDFPEVGLFDPTPLMCDARWCYGSRHGQAMYQDVDHLSDAGSLYVATRLAPAIARLLAPAARPTPLASPAG